MATDSLDTDQQPAGSGGLAGGKKYGPFTAQVWAIIIIGGAAGGFLLRRFSGGSSSTPTNTADAPLTDANNPANYGYTATGGPLAGGGGSTTDGTGAVAQITSSTNTQWGQVALSLLLANGADPATAQQAIGNFLDGLPLTAQQKNLISLAIRLAGAPPEGAPPITDAATPAVDGGSGQSTTSTPVANPAQPVNPPTDAGSLNATQQQWVGQVVATYGLLNQGGPVATANFPKAQFLFIRSNDPNLKPLVGIAYNAWLKSQGDPNHLSV